MQAILKLDSKPQDSDKSPLLDDILMYCSTASGET